MAVVEGSAADEEAYLSKAGLAPKTGNCDTIAAAIPGANTAVLTCTIASPGRLGDAPTIALHRSTKGIYTCVATGFNEEEKYLPAGCLTEAGADDA
jgi:type IV pilus assembly protein PilA